MAWFLFFALFAGSGALRRNRADGQAIVAEPGEEMEEHTPETREHASKEGSVIGQQTVRTDHTKAHAQVSSLGDPAGEGRLLAALVAPPKDPVKFPAGTHLSQIGQDAWVDSILQGRRDLFVVESGANDGITDSNSAFFESDRAWSCLLVEANPALHSLLLGRKRNCVVLKGGLSITSEFSEFDFKMADEYGGIMDSLTDSDERRIESLKGTEIQGEAGSGKVVKVPCFPLNQVLRQLNRTVVDFWSLDTEGSELAILQHVDFSEITVGVLIVEHNDNMDNKNGIKELLESRGFVRATSGHQDDSYVFPRYFNDRGLPLPM